MRSQTIHGLLGQTLTQPSKIFAEIAHKHQVCQQQG